MYKTALSTASQGAGCTTMLGLGLSRQGAIPLSQLVVGLSYLKPVVYLGTIPVI